MNKFAMPRLDNYYSDYHQLTFITESKYMAYYLTIEDRHGMISEQYMVMNLFHLHQALNAGFGAFIHFFIEVWMHEWLHLIGLTDLGVEKVRKLGFFTK